MTSNSSTPLNEGYPTVRTGDYAIPKHKNWVEIEGKYLVDFNDVVEEARIGEYRAILGIDLDKIYPEDKLQDFISVPSEWINRQISEIKLKALSHGDSIGITPEYKQNYRIGTVQTTDVPFDVIKKANSKASGNQDYSAPSNKKGKA